MASRVKVGLATVKQYLTISDEMGKHMMRIKITVARALQAMQGRSVPSGYFWN
jgi:hypothetical protein